MKNSIKNQQQQKKNSWLLKMEDGELKYESAPADISKSDYPMKSRASLDFPSMPKNRMSNNSKAGFYPKSDYSLSEVPEEEDEKSNDFDSEPELPNNANQQTRGIPNENADGVRRVLKSFGTKTPIKIRKSSFGECSDHGTNEAPNGMNTMNFPRNYTYANERDKSQQLPGGIDPNAIIEAAINQDKNNTCFYL